VMSAAIAGTAIAAVIAAAPTRRRKPFIKTSRIGGRRRSPPYFFAELPVRNFLSLKQFARNGFL
jgi:hypothetical protein